MYSGWVMCALLLEHFGWWWSEHFFVLIVCTGFQCSIGVIVAILALRIMREAMCFREQLFISASNQS